MSARNGRAFLFMLTAFVLSAAVTELHPADGVNALGGTISEPAWKARPSWYLLTTEDRVIPPDAQRRLSKRAGTTVVEVKGSQAVYVSLTARLRVDRYGQQLGN